MNKVKVLANVKFGRMAPGIDYLKLAAHRNTIITRVNNGHVVIHWRF